MRIMDECRRQMNLVYPFEQADIPPVWGNLP